MILHSNTYGSICVILISTRSVCMNSRITTVSRNLRVMRRHSLDTCQFCRPFPLVCSSFLFIITSRTLWRSSRARNSFTLPLYTGSIMQGISSSTFWITSICCRVILIATITERTSSISRSSMKSLT